MERCTMRPAYLFGVRTTDDVLLPFATRARAGALLARKLARYTGRDVLVLGIPRGGVPVAAAIAAALGAELDVAVARKLGAPYHPELAIGAITADGTTYLNPDLVRHLGITTDYLASVQRAELAEARRREARFRGARPRPRIEGRTVIVVDDGLATGATMRAAVEAVRRKHPARLIVAVPVGSREACAAMRAVADEIVCLAEPEPFPGVGLHYRSFPQLEDDEVIRILAEAADDMPALHG